MTRAAPRAGRRQGGMTLVELMIAMVILGIVIAVAFNVAFTMMAAFRDHRRAMAVERSARGAVSVLSDAIRNSSPGMPSGAIVDLVGCETSWQGLHVDNDTDGPDALSMIYATGGVITSLRAAFDQASTQVVVEDGSQLVVGDEILITDFTKGHLVKITSVAKSGLDWNLGLAAAPSAACAPPPANFSYLVRATVLKAQVARYSISDTDVPILMMDPDGDGPLEEEAVAEGVEDLQIAVGVDDSGDGSLTEVGAAGGDDEWYYNVAGDGAPPLVTTKPWRAVRLTVTARSYDETSSVADSLRPPAEDRDAATVADVFKRRSLSTTVEIRNLQGSP